jgi:ATP-dependent DNA helicase RecG
MGERQHPRDIKGILPVVFDFAQLVRDLVALPRETESVEFKHNNWKPEEIGEYVSALANSACVAGQSGGFLVWGVENTTHAIVGSDFDPYALRVGNEPLENWLNNGLSPRIAIRFREGMVDGKRLVVLEVPSALHTPVAFRGNRFIRVGSQKRQLKDHPERERVLWKCLENTSFETAAASEPFDAEQALRTLDTDSYFELTGQPVPEQRSGIVDRFTREGILTARGGRFEITNLGAVLFARRLDDFWGIARKAVRLIVYGGTNRVDQVREIALPPVGYASGFQNLIATINAQVPHNEVVKEALRREVSMYPLIAIRELVANALIHQDFSMTGTGPIVEIFADRMEVTNPGYPLIDPQRFMDAPPVSRNEALAALCRRANICEERGSGVDKVIAAIEVFQLPPPRFFANESHTQVSLYAPANLTSMTREDRVRACYQHAVLLWLSGKQMNNESLRRRFGLAAGSQNYATRIIADALEAKAIKPYAPKSQSRKHARYIPSWA